MRVTKEALSRYRSALDAEAEKARSYIDRALGAYMRSNPGAGVAETRRFTLDLLRTAMPNFTDLGGTLACDFFDELSEAQDWGNDVSSQLYDMTDYGIVESQVRYHAGLLAEGDAKRFKREVGGISSYLVKRSAYDNMVRNCDENHVRYARVPTGFETCAFCFMLASRGFVYHSRATAKGLHGYHQNCDCIVVPGVPGKTRIDGYDPEGMERRWLQCAGTAGVSPAAPTREKQKAIMREVETRDWHWLYTGEAPKYSVIRGAMPSVDELETAGRLAESGYRSVFRPTRSKQGKRTSDVYFDNGKHRSPWEFKAPKGNGNQTIAHQFEAAAGQSKNLVIDTHWLGGSWTDERLIEEVRQKLNRRKGYKVKRGQYAGQCWHYDQIIVIMRDKSIKKLIRG